MFCLRTLRELKLLKFLSEAGVSENVRPSLFMPVTCNPGLGPSRCRAELQAVPKPSLRSQAMSVDEGSPLQK